MPLSPFFTSLIQVVFSSIRLILLIRWCDCDEVQWIFILSNTSRGTTVFNELSLIITIRHLKKYSSIMNIYNSLKLPLLMIFIWE